MKVVILAGGRGSRLSEETKDVPKPMVEIGGKPIIWHIMKRYSHHGFNDFIICLGYKGYMIKEYFSHYFLHMSDVTIDVAKNKTTIHNTVSEPWKITLVDTGLNTMTGGRVKRIEKYVDNKPFMLTYGDGLSDIDIGALLKFHKTHGKKLTVTAAQSMGRFGSLLIDGNDRVEQIEEKPKGDNLWINGGYFVFEPDIFNYLSDDETVLEKKPLEDLAQKGEMFAYKHGGFWYPMDTMRDKMYLEELWNSGNAFWKI
jgi:glucose-1-phosphate cytidylyltransferase